MLWGDSSRSWTMRRAITRPTSTAIAYSTMRACTGRGSGSKRAHGSWRACTLGSGATARRSRHGEKVPLTHLIPLQASPAAFVGRCAHPESLALGRDRQNKGSSTPQLNDALGGASVPARWLARRPTKATMRAVSSRHGFLHADRNWHRRCDRSDDRLDHRAKALDR